jgi:drug/metabolite transporter (DMT)-like permease
MLDLRWPMGLMFAVVGAMMTIYGSLTASNAKLYERSLGINVNLWWGLVLLVFSALMLAMAYRAGKREKK